MTTSTYNTYILYAYAAGVFPFMRTLYFSFMKILFNFLSRCFNATFEFRELYARMYVWSYTTLAVLNLYVVVIRTFYGTILLFKSCSSYLLTLSFLFIIRTVYIPYSISEFIHSHALYECRYATCFITASTYYALIVYSLITTVYLHVYFFLFLNSFFLFLWVIM